MDDGVVTDFGVTGPEELGWGKNRYRPELSIAEETLGDLCEACGHYHYRDGHCPVCGCGKPEFDESAWWGNCANTFHEEQKQFVYAKRMGLQAIWGGAHPPTYNLLGRSVMDIGGGPVSLLLKCENRGHSVVVDPGNFPPWVTARYEQCGIGFWHGPAEQIDDRELEFDEAWIYNVLQHVQDPARVIEMARSHARLLRIFEWVDVDPYPGHPHLLTKELLDEWIGGTGYVVTVDESGAVGRAYYGVFAV